MKRYYFLVAFQEQNSSTLREILGSKELNGFLTKYGYAFPMESEDRLNQIAKDFPDINIFPMPLTSGQTLENLKNIHSIPDYPEKLLEKREKIMAQNAQKDKKLPLPSIKEQNKKIKAFYDSRKEGDLLGLKLNRFPQIQQALDGLQDGFYLIGADPNLGKSGFSQNLLLDVVGSNSNVIALLFSLDDTAEDSLTRMIANIAEVKINDIKASWRLDKEEKHKVNEAYKKLDSFDGRLFVLDQEQVRSFENIKCFIEKAKANNKDKKIAVFIDAILNLDVDEPTSSLQIRELNITRANKLKELTKQYSIPLVCTIEFRKRNKPEEAPNLSDIMETGKYAYNANLVWLLHSTSVEMEKEETKISLLYSKNKLSGYKKTAELLFTRKYARIEEIGLPQNNTGTSFPLNA